MAVVFTKPYLSVPEQVALLKRRGMVISDDGAAEAYLRRIGYYRLSGYWHSWRNSTPPNPPSQPALIVHDDFRPGAEFRHVVELYVFDKKLRLLILDGIERIEVGLRTEIALLLGLYSPVAHRDPTYLSRRFTNATTNHTEWLKKLDKSYSRSKEDFAKHYKAKYLPPAPLWIAVELWDFGMLSHFLEGMRDADLNIIAAKYGFPRRDLLTSWVRSINFVRNVCAHHGRLWNRSMIDQPKSPALGAIPSLDHLVTDMHAQERLYGVAVAIRYLLQKVNPSTTWGARLGDLLDKFPSAPGISIRHMGFPSDWQRQGMWP
jgi:abortive infection bacteriophage resistance protein